MPRKNDVKIHDYIPSWAGRATSGSQEYIRTGKSYCLKRPFDISLAVIGICIAFPIGMLIALAIKSADRGPIFFSQDRWGKGKTRIRILKFRTMVPDAIHKFGNIQAQANDPRITKVGRLLRATSLDEMPQLINILKGDMSWVGPRALPIDEIQTQEDNDLPDEQIPGFELRSQLRPGLTGVTQIFAPRDIPRTKKYKCDSLYIESQSLFLDIRLILISLALTIRARWETKLDKK